MEDQTPEPIETCSFCLKPLNQDDMPNLFVDDKAGQTFLRLHIQCVSTVIRGLEFGERGLMN